MMQEQYHMAPSQSQSHSIGEDILLTDGELEHISGGGQVPTGEYLVFTIPNASDSSATGYFKVSKSGD